LLRRTPNPVIGHCHDLNMTLHERKQRRSKLRVLEKELKLLRARCVGTHAINNRFAAATPGSFER
jgi:hypothetical protein